MANSNNPHGLKPLGICLGGGPQNFEYYNKAATYGTALFVYDAVNRVSGGTIEASATPGTTLYTGVNLNYGAATKLTSHTVLISPDALYEAQGDGSGALNTADMGLNANLILSAGSATTKLSAHQVAESTKQTTNTLDVHLLQLLNVPDNVAGAYARVEFVFNKHRMAPGVAGV